MAFYRPTFDTEIRSGDSRAGNGYKSMNQSDFSAMLGDGPVVAAACPALLYEETPTTKEKAVSPRSRKVALCPDETMAMLIASPDSEDHVVIPEMLAQSDWEWNLSRNRRKAERQLARGRIGVVLCERDLPDGGWQDLLETCRSLEKPPSFIVCSRLADELLWSEVLNLGGYDVLMKPFEREEVVRVVYAAWRSWQRALAEPSGGRPVPRVRTSGAGAF
jgi:CheY-like chemotaxis protein